MQRRVIPDTAKKVKLDSEFNKKWNRNEKGNDTLVLYIKGTQVKRYRKKPGRDQELEFFKEYGGENSTAVNAFIIMSDLLKGELK